MNKDFESWEKSVFSLELRKVEKKRNPKELMERCIETIILVCSRVELKYWKERKNINVLALYCRSFTYFNIKHGESEFSSYLLFLRLVK